MKIITNPFLIRATEYINSDEQFIKFFSPDILNIFKQNEIWNTVNIIRSSPGGGKTTLFKIFKPLTLLTIKNGYKSDAHYKLLYNKLYDLNVFTDHGVNLTASVVSFNDEYSSLNDLEVTSITKKRLFFSLLNSRIVLSFLRSLCELKELNFPDDLKKININNKDLNFIKNIRIGTLGLDYYNWACEREEHIINELDSVLPIEHSNIAGEEELFSLKMFNPTNITINNKNLNTKTLVMLDDLHNLAPDQRKDLFKNILDMRPPMNVWLSERRQAMTADEVFSLGSIEGRDEKNYDLEQYWRKGKKTFRDFSKSVADKRVDSVTDGHITQFEGCLSHIFGNKVKDICEKALKQKSGELESEFGSTNTFKKWLENKKNQKGSTYEKLIGWRSLEILLHRDRNTQNTFEFVQLDEDNLNKQEGSDVKNAAKLFISNEYNLPYYFGFDLLSKLASYNIEQFLGIASDLFEDIISASISNIIKNNKKLEVKPERQQDIITKHSKLYWNNISKRLPDSDKIKNFLDAVGTTCHNETYLPNAPISPGVTGIGILMTDYYKLKNILCSEPNNQLYKLGVNIANCISYNLLEYRLNHKCKNKEWFVLYLNRLLCVKYKLPLSYGGFSEQTSLNELRIWQEIGYNDKDLWNQK